MEDRQELMGIMTKFRHCCAKLELGFLLLFFLTALSVLVVSSSGQLIWEDEDTEIVQGMAIMRFDMEVFFHRRIGKETVKSAFVCSSGR